MRRITVLLGALLVIAPAASARPLDRDGDRLPDRLERRHGSSPKRKDTDRDRLRDGFEVRKAKTSARKRDSDRDRPPDGVEDADRDGLSNLAEQGMRTHPRRRDTDRDGLADGEERPHGTNPRKKDSDGDGWADGREVRLGSKPTDRRSRPSKPDTKIASAPKGLSAAASSGFRFEASVPVASFQCRVDAAAWKGCGASSSFSPGDGGHSLQVRAVNSEGWQDPTPASFSWSIDTVAPAVRLASAPGPFIASTTAKFSFSSEAGAALECQRDAAAWRACTSPVTESSLSQGSHGFAVRARDAAGNVSSAIFATGFTVDTVAPNTTITSWPNPSTGLGAFTFTSTEAGSFECRVDSGAYQPCASGVSYSGLSIGWHQFRVHAVDLAGNRDGSAASMWWRVY
jgi:hypothetical protein